MKLKTVLLIVVVCSFSAHSYAQLGQDTTYAVITTAVPFLAISPDARHAALGDAGVATSPDVNAAYWNAGKLAFIDKKYGGAISITPWLAKIINDMWIASLAGFYKMDKEQTIGASMKYFDLGDIFITDNGVDGTNFNPREFAFDVTYSRMLSSSLGVGLTGRYIHSNLTGSFGPNGSSDAKPASTVAADLGVYYTKPLEGSRASNLSLGLMISNIGGKISYSNSSNKDFLPTNLRLGGTYTTELDPYNSFSFILDFNKLLVPTIDKGQTVIGGMLGSFDRSGKEELHEVMTSAAVEYWYNKMVAARLGYFLEAKDKGNRKYMTIGVGFRSNKAFGIDIAYLVPTNKREHPLAETIRFTLLLQVNQNTVEEESVTD
jgi:hypothetical protein